MTRTLPVISAGHSPLLPLTWNTLHNAPDWEAPDCPPWITVPLRTNLTLYLLAAPTGIKELSVYRGAAYNQVSAISTCADLIRQLRVPFVQLPSGSQPNYPEYRLVSCSNRIFQYAPQRPRPPGNQALSALALALSQHPDQQALSLLRRIPLESATQTPQLRLLRAQAARAINPTLLTQFSRILAQLDAISPLSERPNDPEALREAAENLHDQSLSLPPLEHYTPSSPEALFAPMLNDIERLFSQVGDIIRRGPQRDVALQWRASLNEQPLTPLQRRAAQMSFLLVPRQTL